MERTLFVEVHYTIKEGLREEFIQKIKEAGIAEASRAEAGNSRYEYFYPVADANRVVLLELWKSAEDQKAHAQTAHYQALTQLKKEYVVDTQIQTSTLESNQ